MKAQFLALGLLFSVVTQAAVAAFPDKPVKIIVPFPTGAGGDAAARVVAKKLSDIWKQPVVIENRAGPPGVQGVTMAPPDGYTLLVGNASLLATGPLMNPSLPYRPQRDLVPIGQIMSNNPILVASGPSGIKTFKELVDRARATPGQVAYASAGIGSTNHLTMDLLQSITNTKMTHVPYKGGGMQVQDVIAGHIDISIFALPSVLAHVNAGTLKPLAIVGLKRDRSLPQVPTLAELGVKGVGFSVWFGLYAPAKTSANIVHKIGADLERALKDKEVSNQITMLGGDPIPLSPVEFANRVNAEIAMWADLIKKNKLTPE